MLTLPPEYEVSDLKWLSVWCRRFSVNFGDIKFDRTVLDTEDNSVEEGRVVTFLVCLTSFTVHIGLGQSGPQVV